MTHLGSVPYNSGDPRLTYDLPATLCDPLALLQRLWLMVPGQGLCSPDVGVVLVLTPEHDGGVAHVTHVDLPPSDEGDAGGGARCAGQTARCLGPFFCNCNP